MMTEEDKQKKAEHETFWTLIWDRFLDSFDVIVAKITSGRFLAITVDTFGYSAGVVLCGVLAYKQLIEPATFISVLSTYALLVQKTRENYFGMNKDKASGDALETKTTETTIKSTEVAK